MSKCMQLSLLVFFILIGCPFTFPTQCTVKQMHAACVPKFSSHINVEENFEVFQGWLRRAPRTKHNYPKIVQHW